MTKKKSLVGIEKLITKFLACCNWWKCVPLIETYFSCKSTKPILVTNAPQTPRSPIWKRVAGPKGGKKNRKSACCALNWSDQCHGETFSLCFL